MVHDEHEFCLSVANIIKKGRLPLIIFIADHICFNISIFCFNTYTIQGIHISRLAYIFVIIVAALQFTILQHLAKIFLTGIIHFNIVI